MLLDAHKLHVAIKVTEELLYDNAFKLESSPFYADGIVYFRSTANNGYSGDLEIALIPEWFRTETLSLTADPREYGLVKSRIGDTTSADTYANWYKNVYVPQAKGEAPKPTGH